MRRLGLDALLLCAALTGSIPPAQSLPEDRDQPIRLEADRAQFDQNTGISVYEGRVVVSQGSMRLEAEKATVYLKDGRLDRVEAIGAPITMRYRPSADKPELHGVSQRVEYHAVKALVIMQDNARLTQAQDTFSGDRIEYDLNKDVVKASGAKGGRIEFIIQPQSLRDQPR